MIIEGSTVDEYEKEKDLTMWMIIERSSSDEYKGERIKDVNKEYLPISCCLEWDDMEDIEPVPVSY